MKNKRFLCWLILFIIFSLSFSLAQDFNPRCIVIYGDSRTNHSIHKKIVHAIVQTKPQAVFHTGDMVENGFNPFDWQAFNKITYELRKIAKFYPALGNHERESPLFFRNFNLPRGQGWYSLEIGQIHFIVLDSNLGMLRGSKQYNWLEADLKKVDNNKIKFIIVILHYPLFSTSIRPGEQKFSVAEAVPLFEKHGVDMVFSGHAHNYERSYFNNIYYVVTGGGGAPLYAQNLTSPYSQVFAMKNNFCKLKVYDNHLYVEAMDSDSNVIDQFQITRKIRLN